MNGLSADLAPISRSAGNELKCLPASFRRRHLHLLKLKLREIRLENELRRQLDAARSATAQERVADANVTGSGEVVPADARFTSPVDPETVRRRIGDKCRKQRICEVWVVQEVKKLGTELNAQALRDFRVFVDREIPLFEGRPYK